MGMAELIQAGIVLDISRLDLQIVAVVVVVAVVGFNMAHTYVEGTER